MAVLKSISIFLLAGLCEIGGGYLVWLWLKEDKPVWYGVLGGFILASYGVVATWQTSTFARVYATYGDVFLVLSLICAYNVAHYSLDTYDITGTLIALLGDCLIYHAPIFLSSSRSVFLLPL